MSFKLSMKLPPDFKKWVWATIAALVIGFIIGYLFTSGGTPGSQSSTVNIMTGGGYSESQSENPIKQEKSTIIFVIIAILVIAVLVTYAYYKEKQKK